MSPIGERAAPARPGSGSYEKTEHTIRAAASQEFRHLAPVTLDATGAGFIVMRVEAITRCGQQLGRFNDEGAAALAHAAISLRSGAGDA
jgi:hypothetical protein